MHKLPLSFYIHKLLTLFKSVENYITSIICIPVDDFIRLAYNIFLI